MYSFDTIKNGTDMIQLEKYDRLSDLVLRLAFTPIFIVGGVGHFAKHDHMLARLQDSPWLEWVEMIASPSLLLQLSGAVMAIAGFTLMLGWWTRLSALALFVTLVPITITIHIAPYHVGPLLKNVAILGGLVHFFIKGPGAYSLDPQLT